MPEAPRPARRLLRVARLPALAFFSALLLLLAYGFLVEPHILRTRFVTVTSPIPQRYRRDAPAPARELRLALLSDLHLPSFGRAAEKVPAALEAVRPDLILIAGDLRNHLASSEASEAFARRLAAIAPVYMVRGDADLCNYRGQCLSCRWSYGISEPPAGFRILRNERVTAGPLLLTGLDDPTSDLDRPPAPEESPALRVLLLHSTHKLEDRDFAAFDLVLAGNTHGGQVLFARPFLGRYDATLDRRFPGGVYTVGSTRLIVSRGVGMSLLPLRLFVPPEIVVIDILPGAKGRSPQDASSGSAKAP